MKFSSNLTPVQILSNTPVEYNVIFYLYFFISKIEGWPFSPSHVFHLIHICKLYASEEAERQKLAQAQIKFCTDNDTSTYNPLIYI